MKIQLNEIIETIKLFSMLTGPIGSENEVSQQLVKEIKPYVNSLETDYLDQVIVNNFTDNKKLKVLIIAHMDEVGFMVKDIQTNGLIKLSPLGAIDTSQCCNHYFKLISQKTGKSYIGVISSVLHSDTNNIKNLFFDLNMSYNSILEKNIDLGDYLLPEVEFRKVDNFIFGKALDNRIGLGILVYLIKYVQLFKSDFCNLEISFVATCHEEFGLYGASTISNVLNPDLCINLDCIPSSNISENQMSVKLGNGMVVGVKCGSHLSDKSLVQNIEKLCVEKKIAFQKGVFDFGTTDSQQLKRKGCKTLDLFVPLKNMHSCISTAELSDIEGCTEGILSFLSELST